MTSKEVSLAVDEPCLSCPNLESVSRVEGTASVVVRCTGDCPEYTSQVMP